MGHKNYSKKKINKKDAKKGINPGLFVLFFAILFFGFLFYLHLNPGLFQTSTTEENLYINVINAHSNENRFFRLSEDQVIVEEGAVGKVVIEVKGNRVRFKESSCPNQTCVKSGWVSSVGETVTCAPNRIMIRIQQSKDNVVPEFYSD